MSSDCHLPVRDVTVHRHHVFASWNQCKYHSDLPILYGHCFGGAVGDCYHDRDGISATILAGVLESLYFRNAVSPFLRGMCGNDCVCLFLSDDVVGERTSDYVHRNNRADNRAAMYAMQRSGNRFPK